MFKILYSNIALKDLEKISSSVQKNILNTIESKLSTNPLLFSKPLKYGLKNFKSLRIENYRVIFFIEKEKIMILLIGHRKEIYDRVKRKLGIE